MATEEPGPPVFGTWKRAYLAVLLWLALQVVAFSLISRMWP